MTPQTRPPPVPPQAAGAHPSWPLGAGGRSEDAQRESACTFSIQHLGDVQVLLCHVEGRVQICEGIVLEGEGKVRREVKQDTGDPHRADHQMLGAEGLPPRPQ